MAKLIIKKPIVDGEQNQPINNNIRNAWNLYVQWLDKKGLKGNTQLDTNNMGNNLLAQYIKENPTTPLKLELIKPIQQDFINLRNYALNRIKQGKDYFQQGVNEENFMQNLSDADNYAGSKTTSHTFPLEYMKTVEPQTQQVLKVENKGFVIPKTTL